MVFLESVYGGAAALQKTPSCRKLSAEYRREIMLSVLGKRRPWEGSMRIIKRRLTCIHTCENSNELVDLIDYLRGSNITGKKTQKIYSFFDIDETLLK